MNRGAWLFLSVLAALAGCSSDSGSGDARTCASDIAPGDWEIFGQPTPLLGSEGIVFDANGSLYVSARDPGDDQVPDQLIEVFADGSRVTVAEAPSILGLESDPMGILGAGIATANLLLFDVANGGNEEIAAGLGEPNFVVTTPWGTILVSDDRPEEGSILEVTWEGEVSVWNDEVPTPNGLVFSLDGSTLYVAATFEEAGLWSIPVSAEGVAGTAQKVVAYEGKAPDGLAIDSEGNVYVALNTAREIAKVDPEGNSSILATIDVERAGPASLAFGQGEFDPCSLYVTSLFTQNLFRVGAGVLGVEK